MSPRLVCACGDLEREHQPPARPMTGHPRISSLRPCRRPGCHCLRFTPRPGVVGLQGDLLAGDYAPLAARP